MASGYIIVDAGAVRALPAIHARYLEDEEDRQVTGWIVGHLRPLLTQNRDLRGVQAEEFPGPELESLEAVVQFAHSPDISTYHAIASAAAPGSGWSRSSLGRGPASRIPSAAPRPENEYPQGDQ